jgi:hypothetical protein
VNWIQLAQDRDQWRTTTNNIINVRSEVFTAVVMKRTISWDIALCFPPALTLVSPSAYSSALKMEKLCSYETSADFRRTAWRYIPQYSTLRRNMPSGFINVGGFLNQPIDLWLLKEEPPTKIWNYNFCFKYCSSGLESREYGHEDPLRWP